MTDVLAEIAALRAEVAQLRAELIQAQAAVEDVGGGEGCDVGLPLVPVGGGGSHMGNTADSEEIDGDVVFASASDANVEVKTEEGEEDGDTGTITRGVYWK